MNKIFQENTSLLFERFAEIGFFSSFHQKNGNKNRKKNPLFPIEEMTKIFKERLEKIDIEKKEILYVFGIELGYPYFLLKEWLKKMPIRRLVFIEKEIRELHAFLHLESSSKILKDQQVDFYFLHKEKRVEEHVQEMADKYPVKEIEMVAIPSYEGEEFSRMRLMLFRKTILSEAIFFDRLFSHHHFENFLPNLDMLPLSFLANRLKGKFKDIPAIICGAGPSLEESVPVLQQLEHRALIIAGGSTLAALSSANIVPHFGMAIDPNWEEYLRLKRNFINEVPLLYTTRVQGAIFRTLNAPFGYMRSAIGGLGELWIEEELDIKDQWIGMGLDQEAMSVTTICLAFARYLGCSPIILCGVDLAYTDQRRYALGIVDSPNAEWDKRMKSGDFFVIEQKGKKPIYSSIQWYMEAESISRYAKKYKKHHFINATEKGLSIQGVDRMSLSVVKERYLHGEWDLRGLVHSFIEGSLYVFSREKLETILSSLISSLLRCQKFSQEIIRELQRNPKKLSTPKMIVAELDLAQEEAYLYFLSDILSFIDRFLERKYRGNDYKKERLIERWKRFQKIIDHYISVFKNRDSI